MKKEMLINVLQPEECRIAIVEDGVLEELYVERASQETYVGNIYKGRIVNIEPSIQAAFVDFGIGRNGFLHLSDVDPMYYKHLLPKDVRDAMDAEDEDRGAPRGRGAPPRDAGRGRPDDRRDRDRGPRVARPEASVTLPEARVDVPPPLPESTGFADEDEGGFGEGLVEGLVLPVAAPEPPRRPEPVERPVAREIPRPPPPRLPDPIDPEESGFGEGILFEDLAPADAETSGNMEPAMSEEIGEIADPAVLEPEVEAAEPEAEAEKPAKRARRPRAKKEATEGEEAPAEGDAEKPKPRARRTRKKAGDEAVEGGSGEIAPSDETPPDAEPRVMGGAERRTTGDEEPEIQPFFEGGAADAFDIDAPNDRFGGTEEVEESSEAFVETESEPAAEVEGGEMMEVEEEPLPVRRDRDDRGDRGRRGGRRGGRDREPAGAEAPSEDAPPRRFRDDEDEGGEAGSFDRPRPRGREGDRGGDRRGGPRGGPNRDRRGGPSGGRPPARDRGYPRPPIQEIFKRGQEVIVQVIKEGIGTKGPTLSTFISIAGRYLVLMPSLNRVGVSRKIEDMDARRRLRDIMRAMNPPKGVGFIVRTAAIEQNEEDLQNDMTYLLRLWQVVVRRIKKVQGACEIYRESDIITRTIRDILSPDIDTIWVDEEHAFATASDFLQIVMPRFASRIRHFAETEPLFHKYGVEQEIAKITQKRLDLPQGGSIIIEQTEALVAIDVNSGTFRADNNAEETAFRMNMLAAKEIARQLRLRDLGGVIVNDFIDMRSELHRRKVEDALHDALKRDRARTKILRISQFGIIEMTRQRLQPSLKKRIYNDCQHCAGSGYVKSNETMSIEVMRLLQLAAHRSPAIAAVVVNVHTEVAFYLLNRKRKEIASLEERSKVEIQVHGQLGVSPDLCDFKCYDANGSEVRLFNNPPPRMFRGPAPRQEQQRRFPQPLD